MKALSLWQPWASAIALGAKRIETRSWKTNYQGPLLIHAGKSQNGHELWCDLVQPIVMKLVGQNDCPGWMFLPFGALVATCDLLGCVRITNDWHEGATINRHGSGEIILTAQELALGNYYPGRVGWILANVRALPKPIPYRGRQGLFNVPDELIKVPA